MPDRIWTYDFLIGQPTLYRFTFQSSNFLKHPLCAFEAGKESILWTFSS